jgi:hypothetical protein
MKPKLIALLVAINDYPDPIPALNGCINDLEKIAGYLETESEHFDINILKLTDGAATKENIAEKFVTHLGLAGTDDVALFYFAGHGTQEFADPVFETMEPDSKLEVLVCYNSAQKKNTTVKWNFLADKELRYLIHKLSLKKPHIITIFDCCHSGDNTKGAIRNENTGKPLERRLKPMLQAASFPERKWEDFIFSDKIPYSMTGQTSLSELLPEGRHIQLAACEGHQSAFENAGEGIFTKTLVEVLRRCSGDISYFDLQGRVKNYLRGRYVQTPVFYSFGDEGVGMYKGFLNKKGGSKPLYGLITYNDALGWILDLGAIHGISEKNSPLNVPVSDTGTIVKADIITIYQSYSQIRFAGGDIEKPDLYASYKTDVPGILARPLGIYLEIADETMAGKLLKILFPSSYGLFLADKKQMADYLIRQAGNSLYISKASNKDIPIIKPEEITQDSDVDMVAIYLKHISQFEFVRNLQNPDSFLFNENAVEVNLFTRDPNGRENKAKIENETLRLNFGSDLYLRIQVINKSGITVYVSLMYLSAYHECTSILKTFTVALGPGDGAWALDGEPISIDLENEVVHYNLPEATSYLKLFMSTADFQQDAKRFELPALPAPLSPLKKGDKNLANAPMSFSLEDWMTRLITVKIGNPAFN